MQLDEIFARAEAGDDISRDEALIFLSQGDGGRDEVRTVADAINRRLHGDVVTYVYNRNVNYTNICYTGCKFCGFARPREAEDAYLHSLETIVEKIGEQQGITEVCIQGGLHPHLRIDFFVAMLKGIKAAYPHIHIHAFSPMEIVFFGRVNRMTEGQVLSALKEAGLDTMCGTAAEILDDRVRDEICASKLRSSDWVRVITTAHRMGIRSTSTIMFGHVEPDSALATHLDVLREIQMRTGGFTEFIPLPFVPYNTVLFREGKVAGAISFERVAHFTAVARIYLQNWIGNLQSSWVKLGLPGALKSLSYGVNDLGGTLFEENISRNAGADHGQCVTVEEFRGAIRAAGKQPVRRDTLYNHLE